MRASCYSIVCNVLYSRVSVDGAIGSLSAVARLPAESVDARFRLGTVVVSDASSVHLGVQRAAAEVVYWHPAHSAGADHLAEGDGVAHGADGRRIARLDCVARVQASIWKRRWID